MWITSSLDTVKCPTAIALGNFDGVHLGHRQVIQPVLRPRANGSDLETLPTFEQRQIEVSDAVAVSGYSTWRPKNHAATVHSEPVAVEPTALPYHATVLTFFPHPQEYFSGERRSLLTPLGEKATQLKLMGVDQMVLLPFNRALANLSPQAFVEEILIGQLQAQHISVGEDFRFGHKRAGTATLLSAIAAQHNIPVTLVPLKLIYDDMRISSSSIRQALSTGDLEQAKQRLGRLYSLTGQVIKGQQMGRTLGFPTANLKLPEEKFIPRQGVYGVWVHGIDEQSHKSMPRPGVMNIGTRPTVSGQGQSVEVHVLNWSGNLYDKTLTVDLMAFLRPEQKFDSLTQLKTQIQSDCERAAKLLSVGESSD